MIAGEAKPDWLTHAVVSTLFATGIGALGLLGWRRKRKAQAVAA